MDNLQFFRTKGLKINTNFEVLSYQKHLKNAYHLQLVQNNIVCADLDSHLKEYPAFVIKT